MNLFGLELGRKLARARDLIGFSSVRHASRIGLRCYRSHQPSRKPRDIDPTRLRGICTSIVGSSFSRLNDGVHVENVRRLDAMDTYREAPVLLYNNITLYSVIAVIAT